MISLTSNDNQHVNESMKHFMQILIVEGGLTTTDITYIQTA